MGPETIDVQEALDEALDEAFDELVVLEPIPSSSDDDWMPGEFDID